MMDTLKVCLVGDAHVGKSAIAVRFVSSRFDTMGTSTLGVSYFSRLMCLEKCSFEMQIWDTAGQEKYRTLASLYYRGAAAVILCYDITDQSTFDSLDGWISDIKKQTIPNDISILIVIAGTKCDLEDVREVPTEEGQKYANRIGALFMETSALKDINIQKTFVDIGKELMLKNKKSCLKRTDNTVDFCEKTKSDASCC